ncbi:MAG: thermonuclease family protein [Siculibacillus sp.]
MRSKRIAALSSALLLAHGVPARAETGDPCLVGRPELVWAARAVTGEEIELVDGRRLRLASASLPRASLGPDGPARRPAANRLAETARARLETLVEARELAFHDLGADRHGRRRGHLLDTETGQWIEAEMVAAGLLRVTPEPDDRLCARALLASERSARTAATGLWAPDAFPVLAADVPLDRVVGDWVVVEGVIRSVGRSGRRIWLNFGDDIRRDFAVALDDNHRERFRAGGLDPDRLRGARVTVRGIVSWRTGPRIEIEGPEEIERAKR